MTIGHGTAAVFDFVEVYLLRNGYPPTLREIADGVGKVSTNGVRYHLRVLERAGYVRVAQGVSRGIQILRRARGRTAERKPRAPRLAASA